MEIQSASCFCERPSFIRVERNSSAIIATICRDEGLRSIEEMVRGTALESSLWDAYFIAKRATFLH